MAAGANGLESFHEEDADGWDHGFQSVPREKLFMAICEGLPFREISWDLARSNR